MFGFFHRQPPAAPVKRFEPPKEFEYNWQLALRLMACESNGDCSCTISAENGTVTLYIHGIRNLIGLARKFADGAYRHFFLHPTYNDGNLHMTFHEPDCYIFGCPREGMEWDLREYAPNAHISAWYENDGSKQIRIAFDRFPCELETERWKVFESYYNIWCS
ncbi:MAG: hypothetical protein IJY97_04965 [Clostridia bacterium]|nr:hypothetical protein [Clostridia bacterium]